MRAGGMRGMGAREGPGMEEDILIPPLTIYSRDLIGCVQQAPLYANTHSIGGWLTRLNYTGHKLPIGTQESKMALSKGPFLDMKFKFGASAAG